MAGFSSERIRKNEIETDKILREEYRPYNEGEKDYNNFEETNYMPSYGVKNWVGDIYIESVIHGKKTPKD